MGTVRFQQLSNAFARRITDSGPNPSTQKFPSFGRFLIFWHADYLPLLMKRLTIVLACFGAVVFTYGNSFAQSKPCTSNPSDVFPHTSWMRTTPLEAGWSMEELNAAKAYANSIGSQSWLVIEHGKIVDSYGPIETVNSLHSARKSFMSALYGLAIAEGKIDITKTLAELGIDDNEPKLTPEEKKATIRDLLMARSGIYHIAQGEAGAMAAARPKRYSHGPGTFWYYNNWDFNALGTIFNQVMKTSLFDYMNEHIALPLQMEDFKLSNQQYFDGPESIHKYYNMEMSARDMARFGHLFLNEGCWDGKEIIPAAWIKESTTPYSDTISNFLPLGFGFYGYMWWVGDKNRFLPNMTLPNGSFAALGAGPQVILVIPSRGQVIVHRTGTDSVCAFSRTDCTIKYLPNLKVFTLLEMIYQAKKPT